jgi:hypothetical protein
MNEQHVRYFAAKFFPHLLPIHAQACVREALVRHGLYLVPSASSAVKA